MWPFSDFQDGFQSSQSTADLFTVVSDRISWCFNRYGTTRAGALDISKTFDRVCHAGLLQRLKYYEISGQIFGLYINDLPDNVICDFASMLMTLLFILSVIRHLVCGNSLNWLLNLIYNTLVDGQEVAW